MSMTFKDRILGTLACLVLYGAFAFIAAQSLIGNHFSLAGVLSFVFIGGLAVWLFSLIPEFWVDIEDETE